MKIGITCYPTYGGSGVVATELGIELVMRVQRLAQDPDMTLVLAALPDESPLIGSDRPRRTR